MAIEELANGFKYFKVKAAYFGGVAIQFPQHFTTTSLKKGVNYNHKPLDMLGITSLDGWLLFKHDNVIGATNGPTTIELEPMDE